MYLSESEILDIFRVSLGGGPCLESRGTYGLGGSKVRTDRVYVGNEKVHLPLPDPDQRDTLGGKTR